MKGKRRDKDRALAKNLPAPATKSLPDATDYTEMVIKPSEDQIENDR